VKAAANTEASPGVTARSDPRGETGCDVRLTTLAMKDASGAVGVLDAPS
jgi:hypothetical protein